jgi:DNA-binding MarR family transcriptional regulator
MKSTEFGELFGKWVKEINDQKLKLDYDKYCYEVGSTGVASAISRGDLDHKLSPCYAAIYYVASVLGGDDDKLCDKIEQSLWEELRQLLRRCHLKIQSERAEKRRKRKENGKKSFLSNSSVAKPRKSKVTEMGISADPSVSERVKVEFVRENGEDGSSFLFIKRRHAMLLNLLRNNQKMTIRELSEILNATQPGAKCSTATIARDLKSLESAGLLKRVGGRSDSGHWEVTVASRPSHKS